VAFCDRLVATLRAVAPVLEEPGVLVVGSEVPNRELKHAARSNLAILSMMRRHARMIDPEPERARVAALLSRLDATDEGGSR
jgi:hypothetical protein